MNNFLTIDLEDYYQVSGMSDVAPFGKWGDFESRVERNTDVLLEALGEVKATFFVLGWEAQKRPTVIKKIAESGHEIATHGMKHRLITSLSEKEFTSDLQSAVNLLEDLTGNKILGHRAPSFSITDEIPWAFEVMAGVGLKYDSSVVPVKRRRGGIENAERKPYKVKTPAGTILEYPLAVMKIMGRKLPVAGGGFFRLYPYELTRWAMRKLNDNGCPVVVYIHPWEFDPGQPRLKSFFSMDGFNHYVGLGASLKKLRKLLVDFDFIPIRDSLINHG